MNKTAAAAIALALGLSGCVEAPADGVGDQGKVYNVYFLGGQSNMDGYGFIEELPEGINAPVANAAIYQGSEAEDGNDGGGLGLWAPLQPGHGVGFASDGEDNTLSDRFGPELAFGQTIAEAGATDGIALIKFSRGGTGLIDGVSGYGSWDPDYLSGNGRNQYDNALTTIAGAMQSRDVDGDGHMDRLVPAGIVWMQGEADAFDSEYASSNYADNLARLVSLLRAALHDDHLPVVIGQITDSGDTDETRVMAFSPRVRAQQQAFVETDRCAALVATPDGREFLADGWHYQSDEYITLGTEFAEAMIALQGRCE